MGTRVRLLREHAAALASGGARTSERAQVALSSNGAAAPVRATQPVHATTLKLLASLACVGCGRAVLVRGARAQDAALIVALARALRPSVVLLEEAHAELDVAQLR